MRGQERWREVGRGRKERGERIEKERSGWGDEKEDEREERKRRREGRRGQKRRGRVAV